MAIPVCREPKKELRKYAVASATVITKGDMLYWDSSNHVVKPVSDFTWDTNLATTQAAVAVVFAGIADESSASGETDPISVDVSGASVYEYDCASTTFYPGGGVAPADSGSSSLLPQKLVSAAAAASIGMAKVEAPYSAKTRVPACFSSAHQPLNVNANVG